MNTIRHIAWSNNKKNKTRSVLIILSIFLSTALLSLICTFAYGLIKMQKQNAAANYGSYYGMCRAVTQQQLREMERHGEFARLGLMASVGMISHEEARVSFTMADKNTLDMSNISGSLKEGTFPKEAREIAAQQEFFESLGYKEAAVGDTVELKYRRDMQHKFEKREFTISGILQPAKAGTGKASYAVYASQEFFENQFEPQERRWSVLFQLTDSVEITYDNAEEVIFEILEKCGVDKKYVIVNNLYLMWLLDPGYETILTSIVIAAVVIILSVIVIYNIFQVGIVQNIKEYGKIRALGATKKQMRRLIRLEGIFLAAYGIPAGTAAGYVIAWASFEWIIQKGKEIGSMEQAGVGIFSVPVLLGAAVLALFTVLLALRRPMKIVSSISPIEALRYQDGAGGKKQGIRKGKAAVTVWSLAAANISDSRKRTVSTILTMGLSCVLFVVLANYIGNIDADYDARRQIEHGQFLVSLDYAMNDKAYPENNLDEILKNNPLNKEFIEKARAIPGVTDVQTRNILFLTDKNGRRNTICVLNEEDFQTHKSYGSRSGTFDYYDQNSIYFGWSHFLEENGFALDQQVAMEVFNGVEKCELNSMIKGAFGSMDTEWVITQELYETLNLSGHASAGWVWIDCDKKDVTDVRKELTALLDGMEHVEMDVFEDVKRNSELQTLMMRLGCYVFLGIIGLIGFMNLANTMIINIITKKQEYGILQAVGMTNRQLNASLQLQGLIFTAGTVFVALLTGLPAGYGVFLYCKENSFFGVNVYHVPVVEIVCMTAAVALLQLILSYLLSRNLKKESLVERIRYQE